MLDKTRIALKFLTYGILLGIFFSPQSGAENRRDLLRWIGSTSRSLRGSVSNLTAER
jgi:hypothetical protein